MEEWIKRKYPDGKIDWREEHARLLSVIEQALPSIQKGKVNASTKILETAIEIGIRLQDQP